MQEEPQNQGNVGDFNQGLQNQQQYQQQSLPKGTNKLSIKDYEQLKVLGKGSYAKVTLVRKIQDEKIYAMKILKKNYIAKKRQEEHTQTERNVLVTCDHPFIIHLQCSFQTEKKLFFVLEFCQGGELFNLLCKRKRFAEEVCRFYSAQMVLALEYLHSKDIIYRDLKPENVLIDIVGYIRLTDFGLSKKNIQNNDAMSVCGTPEYLAPEVLLKKGHGKAVDWWTLGCIIYEMLTGLPPYYSNNRQKLFDNIKTKNVEYPQQISPMLKDLLEGFFQKDPSQRLGGINSQQVKQHPWFATVDWDALYSKKIKPPFIPKVKSEFDVQNFDDEFTQADIFSMNEDSLPEKNYCDFSYAGDQMSPNMAPQQHDDQQGPGPSLFQLQSNNNNQNGDLQLQQNQNITSVQPQVTQNPDSIEMEMEYE